MIDKVYKTIKENGLIKKGDKILIGLSGGADSVCLTHILYTLSEEFGIMLYTAHLNHNIRGREADNDAEFARSFSEKLNIPFELRSESAVEYARKNGVSEELAGRELRYAFFEELLRLKGLDKIATAHNRNDNAETILMNFMRGSGINGLCGIPYKRGSIIRPILDIDREEIEAYCEKNNLKYVTDSTNKEKKYTRNKIRLELIPELTEKFNPRFINTVTENSRLMKADAEFLDNAAAEAYNANVSDGRADIAYLLSQPFSISSRIILKMVCAAAGGLRDFPSEAVLDIIELMKKGRSGSSKALPGEINAFVEYDKLYIGKDTAVPEYEYTLLPGMSVYIEEIGKLAAAEYVFEKNGAGFYFSADKNDEIKIRNRRDGDIFYPVGMNGRKKVKDLFIDMKIPRAERTRAQIIEINGEIAGILGKRYDKRFVFKEKGIKITIK